MHPTVGSATPDRPTKMASAQTSASTSTGRNSVNEKYYSTTSVGRLLGVKPTTVRRWIREGKLEATKFSEHGHLRISERELERFANERIKGR
jgi:excisionase family DNA binding protein